MLTVLWDNDGVLVDTEGFYFQACKEVLGSVGINLTLDQFKEISLRRGESTFVLATEQGVTADDVKRLRTERDRMYAELMEARSCVIDGAEEFVEMIVVLVIILSCGGILWLPYMGWSSLCRFVVEPIRVGGPSRAADGELMRRGNFCRRTIHPMDEPLRALLDSLDAIGEEHEEIYDTECRGMMGEPIFNLFIKPTEGYQMPDEFGLHSSEANQRVKLALARYIDAAADCARQDGLASFHQRLAAFQNGNVKSNLEGDFVDDFFGWWNPGTFDAERNVIEQP